MGHEGRNGNSQSEPIRLGYLTWRRTVVQGRPASYGQAGSGPPVVFVHGWALGHKAYKRALRRLVLRGMDVLAPALPGFGRTAELPGRQRSLVGYSDWLAEFLLALEVEQPALVIGHSFGGGVAIKLAHDHPELVSGLVLLNSIGGSAWTRSGSVVKSMAQRPLWDWGVHFPADLWPAGQVRRVLPVVLSESLPNLLRSPSSFVKVADVARKADLTAELQELRNRQLPVVAIWGKRDRVITQASFEDLCEALGGDQHVTVPGGHTWMLADPDAFGEIMTNVAEVAAMAQALPPSRRPAAREVASLEARRSARRPEAG